MMRAGLRVGPHPLPVATARRSCTSASTPARASTYGVPARTTASNQACLSLRSLPKPRTSANTRDTRRRDVVLARTVASSPAAARLRRQSPPPARRHDTWASTRDTRRPQPAPKYRLAVPPHTAASIPANRTVALRGLRVLVLRRRPLRRRVPGRRMPPAIASSECRARGDRRTAEPVAALVGDAPAVR